MPLTPIYFVLANRSCPHTSLRNYFSSSLFVCYFISTELDLVNADREREVQISVSYMLIS